MPAQTFTFLIPLPQHNERVPGYFTATHNMYINCPLTYSGAINQGDVSFV